MPAVCARIKAYGYGAGRLGTTAVEDAISHLKQFCYLLQQLEMIYSSAPPSLATALMQGKLQCEIVDIAYPEERMKVEISERLRHFLRRLTINESQLKHFEPSKKTIIGGTWREPVTREERVAAFQQAIGWATKLMDCSLDRTDGALIRAAAEWAFDSEESENETIALIQACIGMEVLLGDESQDEPLTTRLADRCAYLLGDSHKDRAVIRDRFRQLYEVRSKLVHGRTPKLSRRDSIQLHFAQFTLRNIIRAEAKMLLSTLEKTGGGLAAQQ